MLSPGFRDATSHIAIALQNLVPAIHDARQFQNYRFSLCESS